MDIISTDQGVMGEAAIGVEAEPGQALAELGGAVASLAAVDLNPSTGSVVAETMGAGADVFDGISQRDTSLQ